jgi:hypothetical protein
MTVPAHFSTLKVALADWVDRDIATYHLSCCLGLMEPEDGSLDGFRDNKHVFWSNNRLGNTLDAMMFELEKCGVLEHDESDANDRFRWNSTFKSSSET